MSRHIQVSDALSYLIQNVKTSNLIEQDLYNKMDNLRKKGQDMTVINKRDIEKIVDSHKPKRVYRYIQDVNIDEKTMIELKSDLKDVLDMFKK